MITKHSASNSPKLVPFIQHGPGDCIEDEKNKRGLDLNQEAMADILGISLKHYNEIINNKRHLSFEICLLLGKVFNTSPDYWANIDLRYRLHNTSVSARELETEIKTRLYKVVPVHELYKKNWLKQSDNFENVKNQIAKLWGLKEFDIDKIEKDSTLVLKTRISENNLEKLNKFSLLVWHKKANQIAETVRVNKFDRDKLNTLSSEIRNYTSSIKTVKDFIKKLNQCGVKFIFLPHLQNTYLDGAVFFQGENPVIAYTSRFNRLDNFWWTVSHELGHILLNHLSKKNLVIIDNNLENHNEINKEERDADNFAGELLIKDKIIKYFKSLGSYITEERVNNFSEDNNLHPSITVGILAYNGMISYVNKNRFNEPIADELEEITSN